MRLHWLWDSLPLTRLPSSIQEYSGLEHAQGVSIRLSAAWRLVESLLSTNPPAREVDDFDVRIRLINGCIIPRLERVTNDFNRDLIELSASPNHQAESAVMMGEHGRQMTQIELMMFMLVNHDVYDGNFWASLVRWQMFKYQESCAALMEDYKEMTRYVSGDRCDIETIFAAVSAAVRRACEEPDPSPENTTVADAFEIRNLYDDPGLKALVESNMFTPQRRRELYIAAEELMYQQPVFPPESYALLSNPGPGNISKR